jgi:hypothetical protein
MNMMKPHIEADPGEAERCRSLWSEVLLTAFEDAIRYGDEVAYSCGSRITDCMSWFLSRDGERVCIMAGVPHERAYQAAKRWRDRFEASGMTWNKFRKEVFTAEITGDRSHRPQ